MKLNELEKLIIVETRFYDSFKEKLRITKECNKKARVQVYEDYIYIEKIEYAK